MSVDFRDQKELNHLIVSEDDVKHLTHFTRDLEKITLQFNIKDNLEKCTQEIEEQLRSMNNLQSLCLFIEGCQDYQSNNFTQIYQLLNAKKLKDVSVNTGLSNNFNDDAAKYLGEALKGQTNLASLCLKFEAYNKLTQNGLKKLIGDLGNIKSLTSFTLMIEEDNKLDSESINQLGKFIAQNQQLITLNLNFGNDTISDIKGWEQFGKCLSTLSQILNLNLCIGQNNNIGVQGIKEICNGISAQKGLQNLKVKLSWRNDTRDGCLKCFGDVFHNTQELRTLQFRINEWHSLSDEALINFSKGLSYLQKLKSIYLQLGHLTNFTSQGTQTLSEALKHLTGLNKLELNIGSNNNFNQEAIQSLSQSIEQMPDLESFKLTVDQGNTTSSQSLASLGKSLGQKNKLKEVRISYPDLESCLGENLLNLISEIKEITSIQDILLMVGETDRIHFSHPKNSLTFSLKSKISNQGLGRFLQTLNNLGNKIQKLKCYFRDIDIKEDDVEKLKAIQPKLTQLQLFKFRSKNLKQTNTVGFLDLFEDCVKNNNISMMSIDLSESFKVQYFRPSASTMVKKSKKQKQQGSSLLFHIDQGQKVTAEGEKIINHIIDSQRKLLKDLNIKIGSENELTKKGLEELSYIIVSCPYLSKLNFDVQDNQDDLKTLLTKIKANLDQQVKEKKNLINTYYAVLTKQYELVSNQINSDILNDVTAYLMQTEDSEVKTTNVTGSTGGFGQQTGFQFGKLNIPELSDSSFCEEDQQEMDQIDYEYYANENNEEW